MHEKVCFWIWASNGWYVVDYIRLPRIIVTKNIEIVTDIDDFLHTTEENEMEPQLRHPRYTNIMCLCYVILNNIQHAR